MEAPHQLNDSQELDKELQTMGSEGNKLKGLKVDTKTDGMDLNADPLSPSSMQGFSSPGKSSSTSLTSPKSEFFLSQRHDFDSNKVDPLAIEEQEILSSIQDLQLQLMKLRAEEDESEDESEVDNSSKSTFSSSGRVIVVSNDLPISIEKANGKWKATKTSLSLEKLMSLTEADSQFNFLWVGCLSQEIPKKEQESVRRLLSQYNCVPVFLSDEIAQKFDMGFSMDVLWPIFHYVSEPVSLSGSSASKRTRFKKQNWRAYESANESFADTITEIYNEGDIVWSHDYHLMLLPSFLRQRVPQCKIGWFLHTPFPSSDVYSRLPVRSQLLTGVLHADLVGFQTYDYVRHFVSNCQRILGLECSPKGVRNTFAASDHFTQVGVYPIGINPSPLASMSTSSDVLSRVNDLRHNFGNKRIILGVDRINDIKGIPHKLLAMEQLLSKYPEYQQNVVLVQIGIQSDDGSAAYRNLLAHVNRLVGRINGAYGSLNYQPIHFIHQNAYDQEELCALYDLADVCLVTSTRDGMNLVSHEFIVSQQHFCRKSDRKGSTGSASESVTQPKSGSEGEDEGPGVLVLSEFAGCSQYLSGAIVINPWNTEDLAVDIHHALSMTRAEREIRQQKLYRYVSTNDANSWTTQFLKELEVAASGNRGNTYYLPRLQSKDVIAAYKKAKNRVIVLDYDRTLAAQHSLLPLAAVGPNFKNLLAALTADENNTVFIVSERERKFLETWLSGVSVGVAAEDGFFYRLNLKDSKERWKSMSKFNNETREVSDRQSVHTASSSSEHPYYADHLGDVSWKDHVLPIMLKYSERTPGSQIENKESSLTWHYGDSDPHFGNWQAKDLQTVLEKKLNGYALEVYQGHRCVIVEPEGCSKANILEGILRYLSVSEMVKQKGSEVDFVLCAGDDTSDEQMFQTLNTLVNNAIAQHDDKNIDREGPISLARMKSRSNSVLDEAQEEETDDDVYFTKLQKVPVRMTKSPSIFSVQIGTEGRSIQCSHSVSSVGELRHILRELADVSKKKKKEVTTATP